MGKDVELRHPSGLAGSISPPPLPDTLDTRTQPPGPPLPTVRGLFSGVFRHKRLILGGVLAGAVLGLVASRFVEPKYLAQVTIWIEPTAQQGGAQGPIRQGDLLQSFGWVELLRSYSVLDRVVEEERLYLRVGTPGTERAFANFRAQDPFQPGSYTLETGPGGYVLSRPDGFVERGALGDSIGRGLGFHWLPGASGLPKGKKIRFEVLPIRDAAVALGLAIEPIMTEDGRFLRLELRGANRTEVARVLNAAAEQYVRVAAELKRTKLDQLAAILRSQLDFAARNLQGEEAALERFRVYAITLPSDRATPVTPGVQATQEPAFQNYFSLNMERDQVRRDRDALGRALNELGDKPQSLDPLRLSPAVQRSAALQRALDEDLAKEVELRTLLTRYRDDYPAVQRLRGEITNLRTQVIPPLAATLSDELQAREGALDTMINSAGGTLQSIPRRVVEEARLRRRVEIAETLYKTLQQRYEEARLAAVSSLPDVRVQDHAAVPFRPVDDRRSLVVVGALLASLAVSLLAAILLDRIDPRLHEPDEIAHMVGLPPLGAVPLLRPGRRHLLDEANCREAVRGIRINLVHSFGSAPPLIAAITSPGAGDGKSFLSRQLCASFAETGQSTVLVDADTRRGLQHRDLAGQRSPGLTDYLLGQARLDDVLQVAPGDTPFHFISMGRQLEEAPKLLETPAMARLLLELRARFRVILVDCPPLGAAADPIILGMQTGNMILVLRAGVSDRALTAAKLEVLQRLPTRLLGTILNAVSAKGSYRYHAYYIPGYEPAPASTPAPSPAPTSAPPPVPQRFISAG